MSGVVLPKPAASSDPRGLGTLDCPTPREKTAYVVPWGVTFWITSKIIALAISLAGHHWAAVALYLSLDGWFLWQIITPASQGFGPIVARFLPVGREVWLTIDDGPDPLTTPRVLELLDQHKARATFFVIGENVRRHPELAIEIVRRGHTLANHTDTHPSASFWAAGSARIKREIDGCNSALQQAGLAPTAYFRAPVGIKTLFIHPVLAERGMAFVAWSARGYDSVANERTATRRILRGLTPGAIVLLHEGRADSSRVTVVEGVLQGLSEAGFSTVIPERSSLIV